MRMLSSNRWPISAKKIVSPFQTPMKNPGGSYASGIGWCAHDTSNSMDASSAAKYSRSDGFIVLLTMDTGEDTITRQRTHVASLPPATELIVKTFRRFR